MLETMKQIQTRLGSYRCVLFVTVFTVLFTLNLGAVSAAETVSGSLEETKKMQEQVKREMEQLEDDHFLLGEQVNEINHIIRLFDERIAKNNNDIAKIEKVTVDKSEEIEELKIELDKLHDQQEKYKEIVKERLRFMERSQSENHLLEVILSSESFGDLVNRVLVMSKILENDNQNLMHYSNINERLNNSENLLSREVKVLKEMKHKLKLTKQELESNKQEREGFLETVETMMESKKKEIVTKESELNRLKEKESALAAMENRRNQIFIPANADQAFIAPTHGRFSSPFGQRWGSLHAGVDIANNTGTPVVASAGGQVIWANYVNGYGNTVLLQHTIEGDTYQTLYGHLDKVGVSIGQAVEQGQYIGDMGNTGRSFGSHLHFEIHVGVWNQKKTNAIDPLRLVHLK